MVSKNKLLDAGAAILRHRTSDVSQIGYVTGALLKQAKLGGFVIMTYANRDILDISSTNGQT